jgi:hypothetical protein
LWHKGKGGRGHVATILGTGAAGYLVHIPNPTTLKATLRLYLSVKVNKNPKIHAPFSTHSEGIPLKNIPFQKSHLRYTTEKSIVYLPSTLAGYMTYLTPKI